MVYIHVIEIEKLRKIYTYIVPSIIEGMAQTQI